MTIEETLAAELSLQLWQVQAVIELLDEGCTIPFIARYRKEKHGGLDDTALRTLVERLDALKKLEERKTEILESMEKLGVLTEELKKSVAAAATLSALEDIYRPYRPKKRTRAMIAREKGLEPLANLLMLQPPRMKPAEEAAQPYVDPEKGVETAEDALQGAMDIIAEQMSDDAEVRARLRTLYGREAVLATAQAKEEDSVYRMYYGRRERLSYAAPHRVMAINRGEKEGFLKVALDVEKERCLQVMKGRFLRREVGPATPYIERTCEDAFTRLIQPSLENEWRAALTEKAQEAAVNVFAKNLRPLLMQPPIRGRRVIGLDPGIRTGCKVAVVDETGLVLDTAVIFPLPQNKQVDKAKATVKALVKKHGVSVAAIGNGTAGRETEQFFAEVISEMPDTKLEYVIVSEDGASVYSASELAAKEFPQFDVTLRSAVSIARRLQDPLAELVKIDPKSIGVGQYQHDVKGALLDHALSGVVEDCVNRVGVDVNTASPSLLKYVSGLNATTAANIVTYREANGAFKSRSELKKVPRLGAKAFELCAGFLRIPGAKEIMDDTGVHPESYAAARALMKELALTPAQCAKGLLREKIKTVDEKALAEKLGIGVMTLRDIVDELSLPGRDPRDSLPKPMLRRDVLSLSDLSEGMTLMGTVRNVTDFGAFIDIGVHRDGLLHISRMGDKTLRHPTERVSVGDVIEVTVLEVDRQREKISLTL